MIHQQASHGGLRAWGDDNTGVCCGTDVFVGGEFCNLVPSFSSLCGMLNTDI